jgi:hypothetical protein
VTNLVWRATNVFEDIGTAIGPSRDKALRLLQDKDHKPKIFAFSTYSVFFSNAPAVARLIGREPEILVFAGLQWIVIVVAYMAWTQLLQWIPDSVWDAVGAEEGNNWSFIFTNLLLLSWSFFIVCIASYPIGLCTAAMIAVHDLRTSNERVTIAKCLAIADRHLGRIWAFTIWDSWITVTAIFDRLPKKHSHRTALDELLYYAWKVSTLAVLPALVNGRTFVAAGRDSITLLTTQPSRAFGLRFGYSAICWVVGIAAYVGAFYFRDSVGGSPKQAHGLYNFYFLMAVPIFFAVGIVSVIVRPFYVLSVASFYTELVGVKKEVESDTKSVSSWEMRLLSWQSILFLAMAATLLITLLFSDQLGIRHWVAYLTLQDLIQK